MLPVDYHSSRQAFIEEAHRAGASVAAFPLQPGSEQALSTDVAFFGGNPSAPLVFIASGTHGIEGYAGAACQLRFMENHARRYAQSGLGFVLVHAVNPWGFFHDRRVTQEGVDLNRNFIDFQRNEGATIKMTEEKEAVEVSAGYGAYHGVLLEHFRPLPSGWRNEARLLAGALTARQRKRIKAAITHGQHSHPTGLFFGGQAATRSRKVWESIVQTYSAGRTTVVLLDLHTGLGPHGHGELLSYLPPTSRGFQEMNAWLHGEMVSMAQGDAVSAAVAGTLTEGFDRLASGESFAIGLEFGTRAALPVLYALRLDHWVADHAGPLSPAWREKARSAMRRAFRPDDPRWLAMVFSRFEQVMDWIAEGLVQKQNAGKF